MREIEVLVRRTDVDVVRRIAEEHAHAAPTVLAVESAEEHERRQMQILLRNERVGAFVEEVASRLDDVQFLMSPHGVIPLRERLDDLDEHVADVSRRSTMELVVDGLQSIGSWRGMILYAFISGLVAAYGVIFDTVYLLTASMLIAPMGAPAMVAVIGVTLGESKMIRRGTIRFFAALGVATAAGALLGGLYGLRSPTPTMEEIAALSKWAILLAVAGGAAGAQALVRSERDSLVTATATGFLVAVALSPPAAVLGLSLPMMRGQYALLMSFNLVLTFFGILLGGWLSLRFFGVTPGDAPGRRGHKSMATAMVVTVLVLAGALTAWQARAAPDFQKADLTQDALQVTRDVVGKESRGFRLLDVRAVFLREEPDWLEAEGLLVRAVVHPTGAGGVVEELRTELEGALRHALPGVEPFVDMVTVP